MTRRLLACLLAVAALAAAGSGAAFAQAPDEVRIREAALDDDGQTRLVVSVTGDEIDGVLDGSAFRVTEAGEVVDGLAVEPLLESRVRPVVVTLLMDVSGSTQGEPLDNAKAAATAFAQDVTGRGVRVSVVSFGETAEVVTGFTADSQALADGIASLEPDGETAMYDGLLLAVDQLRRVDAQRNLVLFSDGGDTASNRTLDEAVEAAVRHAVPVTSVALATPEQNQGALDRLSGETGGQQAAVSDAAGLSASFEQVAQQLASQYVLTYTSTRTEPRELDLAVSVDVNGTSLDDAIVVANTRAAPETAVQPSFQPVPEPAPIVGLLGSRVGLYVGVGSAFLALALLLGTAAFVPASDVTRALRRGVGYYTGGVAARDRQASRSGLGSDLAPSELARRAVNLAERFPKPTGYDERLQLRLDRAGWALRANEFLVLQAIGLVVGVLIGGGMLGNWFLAILFGVVGVLTPHAVLGVRTTKRTNLFLEQLPDTLQVIAGSLRAGHGLLQSIDTVVQESGAPTSTEFSRVLTEARLGMPLDEALEAMAFRMGSEDFRWVVLAINIQRQVGGNLAQLLETVANTLRERAQTRRQIKVLSAEGRLSAVVLTVLPVALAAYMSLVNPQYIGQLFSETLGLIMVAGSVVLIAIGALWMRKLIRIDV